ncbi:uncharacterized skeletal organic matrix protein 5-like [Dendronephthya gigantea]|uniref:uncharacterized skeletal organic matrix protein 5-like n=1 Tax=Dendronephthya gigantea TaxID=151771 RepID=UPI0010692B06|nr:uncharacterized skeletal organic matrix protein 5-like [Dendronephthya gigantea]
MYCLRHSSCSSVNYKIGGDAKGRCELNRKTTKTRNEKAHNPEYIYLEKVRTGHEVMPSEAKHIYPPSCKELLHKNTSLPNGVYTLQQNISSSPYKVYCHMKYIPGCGGAGWTLVMKLDGKMETFKYSSSFWTNNETYAIQDGLEGLTEKESKLASYWNTPFTKICLGMSYNGDREWMSFDYTASSLYGAIADGQFRATTAGRAAWKSLIAESSLQLNCNEEGFNVLLRMRIGIFANNENECYSCDSWLGFGTQVTGKTCGNFAVHSPDNGYKDLATFGYILVQP